MTDESKGADLEFAAMRTVYTALEGLDEGARARVLDYVSSRLGLASFARPLPKPPAGGKDDEDVADEGAGTQVPELGFSSFAELFDAVQPKTNSDRALVAGYWLQVCGGTESFDAFSANRELKHLGEGLANITSAIDALKGQKPALALQLKKSGKSQQARKIYKVTHAGVKAVEAMISG